MVASVSIAGAATADTTFVIGTVSGTGLNVASVAGFGSTTIEFERGVMVDPATAITCVSNVAVGGLTSGTYDIVPV
jgi:hypothetical protein